MLKKFLSFFSILSIIGLNTIPVLAATGEKTSGESCGGVRKRKIER